jgi:hypothetical protein
MCIHRFVQMIYDLFIRQPLASPCERFESRLESVEVAAQKSAYQNSQFDIAFFIFWSIREVKGFVINLIVELFSSALIVSCKFLNKRSVILK